MRTTEQVLGGISWRREMVEIGPHNAEAFNFVECNRTVRVDWCKRMGEWSPTLGSIKPIVLLETDTGYDVADGQHRVFRITRLPEPTDPGRYWVLVGRKMSDVSDGEVIVALNDKVRPLSTHEFLTNLPSPWPDAMPASIWNDKAWWRSILVTAFAHEAGMSPGNFSVKMNDELKSFWMDDPPAWVHPFLCWMIKLRAPFPLVTKSGSRISGISEKPLRVYCKVFHTNTPSALRSCVPRYHTGIRSAFGQGKLTARKAVRTNNQWAIIVGQILSLLNYKSRSQKVLWYGDVIQGQI